MCGERFEDGKDCGGGSCGGTRLRTGRELRRRSYTAALGSGGERVGVAWCCCS
jgi:hypothetical protein